jgi:hypothetical protein
MATITPTLTVNPANMAKNWGPGVTQNAQKWQFKTLNPKRMFNADPQRAQADWAAGVARAQAMGTYATKLANVDTAMMANAIATYGTSNYSAAGSNKAAKYAAKTTALAALITSAMQAAAALPGGKGAASDARMLAFKHRMEQGKGTI